LRPLGKIPTTCTICQQCLKHTTSRDQCGWDPSTQTASHTVTMYLPNKHHHRCRLNCECCVTQWQITTWQFLRICPAVWFGPHKCSNLLKMKYNNCNACHVFTLSSDRPTCLRHTNWVQLTRTVRRNIKFLSQASWKKFEIGRKEKTRKSSSCCCLPWEKKSYLWVFFLYHSKTEDSQDFCMCHGQQNHATKLSTAQSYNDFIGGTDK